MMPLTQKRSLAILIIFLFTAFPVFAGIYLSNPGSRDLFEGVRQRKASTDFTKESMALSNRVYLLKDKALVLDNCKLIFKGIRDKMIHIDLILLELDPLSPYPQKMSKPEARSGFRMGNIQFSLVSASSSQLKLQINNFHRTD